MRLEVLETLLLEVLRASRIQMSGGLPRIFHHNPMIEDSIGVSETPYPEGTIQYIYILNARESLSKAFSEILKISSTRSAHTLLGLRKLDSAST